MEIGQIFGEDCLPRRWLVAWQRGYAGGVGDGGRKLNLGKGWRMAAVVFVTVARKKVGEWGSRVCCLLLLKKKDEARKMVITFKLVRVFFVVKKSLLASFILKNDANSFPLASFSKINDVNKDY